MYTFIAQHRVEDFEKWINWGRQGASNKEMMAEMGVVESQVYRTMDGTGVVIVHHFENREKAENFMTMAQTDGHYEMVETMGGAPPYHQWLVEKVDL